MPCRCLGHRWHFRQGGYSTMTISLTGRRILLLWMLLGSVILAGCETSQVKLENQSVPPTNAAPVETVEPSPTAVTVTKAQEQAITLPVIDALFADESFASDAKNKAD